MYNFHKYWMPAVQASIQEYLDFRDKYNVPIWMSEWGENTDEWIAQYRELLDKNRVGWAFWPYKKMDRPRSVVSFARPAYWSEIVAFAKLTENTGKAEDPIAKRPPRDHIDAAFADVLKNVEWGKCHVNQGYLKALGLNFAE